MTTRTETQTGNRLSDMVYDEVSLVTRGANQDSVVVLFKADTDSVDGDIHEQSEEGSTLTRNGNDTKETTMPTGTEDKTKAPDLSALPDDVRKSFEDYVNGLQESNDELRKDNEIMAEALADLDEDDDDFGDEDDTLDVQKLDADTIAKLDPAIQTIVKAAQDANRRAEEAEQIAKSERDRRESAEAVELAKSLTTHTGADVNLLSTALLDIKKNCTEATLSVVTESLRSSNEVAKAGGLTENGTDNGADVVSKAATALEQKRDEIIKLDPTLTKEQALVRAATENPDLYAEHVKQQHR